MKKNETKSLKTRSKRKSNSARSAVTKRLSKTTNSFVSENVASVIGNQNPGGKSKPLSASERLLEKAQKMWNDGLSSLEALPDTDRTVNYYDLRKFIGHRTKLSWASGVFYAFGAIGVDEAREKAKRNRPEDYCI